MILKLLLVLAVIAFVYFVFIKKKPIKEKSTHKNQAEKKQSSPSNEMVECSACGVYTELSESLLSGNKYYCSNECLEKK